MNNISGTWTEDGVLDNIPTCRLVHELEKREGVRVMQVGPEEMHRVQKVGFDFNSGRSLMQTGPAIILEVID